MRRIPVLRPNGTRTWVYDRMGQRRANVDIDGIMCFTPAELGVQYPSAGEPRNMACNNPRPISDALLNERTVVVKPWWLYRDYRSANPTHRYDETTWATMAPGYVPAADLLTDEAGNPVTQIRVCREEAKTAAQGRPFVPGPRTPTPATGCNARLVGVPNTTADATALMGQMLSCETQTGFNLSIECGCGVGLERCLPGAAVNSLTAGAMVNGATRAPIGNEAAFESRGLTPPDWMRLWFSQEATHFMDAVFQADRDVRDFVRARDTYVNGPLALFYRSEQGQSCCNSNHLKFGYAQPTHLFNPANVPTALLPHDVDRWARVPDRGPLASGILTMPIFLTKYGTRRARAHVLYQTLMCQEFVAPNVALMPSDEPDLTRRNGCLGCHRTLEPLAAYFTRVAESDWTYLPPAQFALDAMRCRTATPLSGMPSGCAPFYDPAFTNSARSWMRGIYNLTAAQPFADAGPRGMGDYLAARPEYTGPNLDPKTLPLRVDAIGTVTRSLTRSNRAIDRETRSAVNQALLQETREIAGRSYFPQVYQGIAQQLESLERIRNDARLLDLFSTTALRANRAYESLFEPKMPGTSTPIPNPWQFEANTLFNAAFAVEAFKLDLARCVSFSTTSFDTHFANYEDHPQHQQELFNMLAGIIDALSAANHPTLAGRKLIDHTHILVMSEFCRTPQINVSGGRDHYPNNSALIVSQKFRGNMVFGSSHPGQLLSETRRFPDGMRAITPADILATMLDAFGIDPRRYMRDGAVMPEIRRP